MRTNRFKPRQKNWFDEDCNFTVDGKEYPEFESVDLLPQNLDIYMIYLEYYKNQDIHLDILDKIFFLKEEGIFTTEELNRHQERIEYYRKKSYPTDEEILQGEINFMNGYCKKIIEFSPLLSPGGIYSGASVILESSYGRKNIDQLIDTYTKRVKLEANIDIPFTAYYLLQDMIYLKKQGISLDTSWENYQDIIQRGIVDNNDYCLCQAHPSTISKERVLQYSYGSLYKYISILNSGFCGMYFNDDDFIEYRDTLEKRYKTMTKEARKIVSETLLDE